MNEKNTPVIISVGGSLIVPQDIDTQFLSSFKALILEFVSKGFRFVIITGGGKTARRYQDAGNTVTPLSKEDRDWLGIHSTRLNAHLMRSIFVDAAYPIIITNPYEDIDFKESVLIAAGWRPGCSTDFDAVLLAKSLNAKKLINLSNIDYVYTGDPRTDKNAKPIETISWTDFKKLIPEEWDPGLSSPFDPVATREAEKMDMEVAIINGLELDRLRKYLENEEFIGTRISNI